MISLVAACTSRANARAFALVLVVIEHLDIRWPGSLLQQFARAVGGAVIDNDDLLLEGLLLHTANHLENGVRSL